MTDPTFANTVCDFTPADTSGADWYRLKPGVRGRYFKIDISTTATTNAVELRRIEVEVG